MNTRDWAVSHWAHDFAIFQGEVMFKGEFESLKKIMETNTVTVPAPLKVID